MYNQNGQISQLIVQWYHCNDLIMGIHLTTAASVYFWEVFFWWRSWLCSDPKEQLRGGVDQTMGVRSNDCNAGLCSTSFSLSSSDQNYFVRISAIGALGSFIPRPRSPHTGPPQLLLLHPTPHGGHYNLLLPSHHQCIHCHSVDGELHNRRMWSIVYHWYIITVLKLLSLFYNIVDVRLTTTNQALLAIGVILWSVAFSLGIILIIMNVVTGKGKILSILQLVITFLPPRILIISDSFLCGVVCSRVVISGIVGGSESPSSKTS